MNIGSVGSLGRVYLHLLALVLFNPAAVIACVIHFCNDGDNTLLDEKLEQLRTFDGAMGYHRM
jgi:hypothetical protein